MTTLLEKSILNHLHTWIHQSQYSPSSQEQLCLDSYSRHSILSGITILSLFTGIGVKLILPDIQTLTQRPSTISSSHNLRGSILNLVLSIGAISGGAFISIYYSAHWAGTKCITCLLKTKGNEQRLGDQLEEMLKKYHPNAEQYLNACNRDNISITITPTTTSDTIQ